MLQGVEMPLPLFQLVGKKIGDGSDSRPGVHDETRSLLGGTAPAAENPEANLGVGGRSPHLLGLEDHKARCRRRAEEFPPAHFALFLVYHLCSSFYGNGRLPESTGPPRRGS